LRLFYAHLLAQALLKLHFQAKRHLAYSPLRCQQIEQNKTDRFDCEIKSIGEVSEPPAVAGGYCLSFDFAS
jgi:hypothetical protein